MIKILKEIFFATENVLHGVFYSDMDILSPEVKKILDNPKDKKEYIDALHEIEKEEKKEVTIQLSNGEELTLVS